MSAAPPDVDGALVRGRALRRRRLAFRVLSAAVVLVAVAGIGASLPGQRIELAPADHPAVSDYPLFSDRAPDPDPPDIEPGAVRGLEVEIAATQARVFERDSLRIAVAPATVLDAEPGHAAQAGDTLLAVWLREERSRSVSTATSCCPHPPAPGEVVLGLAPRRPLPRVTVLLVGKGLDTAEVAGERVEVTDGVAVLDDALGQRVRLEGSEGSVLVAIEDGGDAGAELVRLPDLAIFAELEPAERPVGVPGADSERFDAHGDQARVLEVDGVRVALLPVTATTDGGSTAEGADLQPGQPAVGVRVDGDVEAATSGCCTPVPDRGAVALAAETLPGVSVVLLGDGLDDLRVDEGEVTVVGDVAVVTGVPARPLEAVATGPAGPVEVLLGGSLDGASLPQPGPGG